MGDLNQPDVGRSGPASHAPRGLDQDAAESEGAKNDATLRISLLPPSDVRESRVCITPEDAKRLIEGGHTVVVSATPSPEPAFTADAFEAVGAEVATDAGALLESDVLVTLAPPGDDVVDALDARHTLIGFLGPFENPGLIGRLAAQGVTVVALELVPRTTVAQPMDALSSQASLAGYAAVMLAASRIRRVFPMMSTAAGTIRPAKVLVLGAGVAGLQAIATAQRLNAQVTAFDVRASAGEQVRSLGAKFAPLPDAADAQAAGGYAKESSDAELARQREHLAVLCSASDVVIATAQVFGRTAPMLVTAEMIDGMRPGSVVVDAAIATGGNVEISRANEDVERGGVTVLADPLLAARVAMDASQVLSANIAALLQRIIDPDSGGVWAEGADEITDAVTLVRGGRVTDERVAALVEEDLPEDTR